MIILIGKYVVIVVRSMYTKSPLSSVVDINIIIIIVNLTLTKGFTLIKYRNSYYHATIRLLTLQIEEYKVSIVIVIIYNLSKILIIILSIPIYIISITILSNVTLFILLYIIYTLLLILVCTIDIKSNQYYNKMYTYSCNNINKDTTSKDI